jgi:hypothetical protein
MYIVKKGCVMESQIKVTKEVQRFILALTLLGVFLTCFLTVFLITRDAEIAKTVLTVLAGALTSMVGYFFAAKTVETK